MLELASILHNAHDALKIAKTLKEMGALDHVKKFIGLKKVTHILLLGASGAGKSTFRDFIFGEQTNISRYERTSENSDKSGQLNSQFFRVTDTPGQLSPAHEDERLAAIRESMRSARLGIINITAYGYHEGIVDIDRAVDMSTRSARPEYLENRRAEEICQLSDWTGQLFGEGATAQWLITLVNKADLWWTPEHEQTVMKHYVSGDYYHALGKAQRTNHVVLPYSCKNSVFYGQMPMSGFYVDAMRDADHARLLAQVLKNASQMNG